MIRSTKIADPNQNVFYTVTEVVDFEYVNPVERLAEIIIAASIQREKDFLSFAMENNDEVKPPIEIENPQEIIDRVIKKRAVEAWDKLYEEIISTTLPDNIMDILTSSSKKEQEKILEGMSLTGDQLQSLIFKAWQDHGFHYSCYTSSHNHNGLDEKQMPPFAYKNEEEIITIGKTSLTSGQIKQAIEHRHVVIAKFLDKGNEWHCFFYTHKSLSGEEKAWNDGQPHLHYISHTSGLSRDYVLKQLHSKRYKLGSLPHINFYTHRTPPPA
ncbi:MAG TPA: hypothetical protein VK718_06120 [Ferruginibacter sp.]|jgi:hypothetical protein|nr:hypothetical protein [Ferruginibacter sp.]